MSDCARKETASSHWIPELIGSVIATFIIDISLFALFDWSLALASFWVIPVSFLVLMTSSGGERQRISIARALLKDAPVILLDEATASLDVENETKIQQALSHLVKDKTVLIIAHRMRTIANADHIVVLKEGKVAEKGTPEELMSTNGIYRHMTNLQMQSAGWKIQ